MQGRATARLVQFERPRAHPAWAESPGRSRLPRLGDCPRHRAGRKAEDHLRDQPGGQVEGVGMRYLDRLRALKSENALPPPTDKTDETPTGVGSVSFVSAWGAPFSEISHPF